MARTFTLTDAEYLPVKAFSILSNTPAGEFLVKSSGAFANSGVVIQPQLNGTGFVKATGTTISYDNTTYQPALNTGQVTVDFGQGPAFGVITTVANANALTASQIYCTLVPTANSSHEIDEYDIDGLQCYAQNIVNGVSFDLVVSCNELLGGVHGEYVINYLIK